MTIRPATPDDADALSALLVGLADVFVFRPEEAGPFLETVEPAAFRERKRATPTASRFTHG